MESIFLKKATSVLGILTLLAFNFSPWQVFAVVDSAWNSINAGFVNSTNSWSYGFNLIFSWTLDAWDSVNVDILDSSGSAIALSWSNAWGSWISFSWVNLSSFLEWNINFSWSVVNSWQAVVASWIAAVAVKDTIAPTITLSSASSTWSLVSTGTVISVTWTLSEPSTSFNSGSLTVSGWTVSNFSWTWSLYSFDVTPSSSSWFSVSVWSWAFTDVAWNQNIASNLLSFWPESVPPVIFWKSVTSITQSWAVIRFNFTEPNFSNWSWYVIAYTGWNIANFAWTWNTTLSSSGSSWSWTSIFSALTWSTNYNYLIHLTDNFWNPAESTWSFTTLWAPVTLSWAITNTWAIVLTWNTVPVWSALNLSGVSLNILSDPNDSGFISGTLSISWVNIVVSWSTAWNWVLIPPTLVESWANLAAIWSAIWTWISVLQTVRAWAEWASLVSSWWFFNVSFAVPGSSSWTSVALYRSTDWVIWTRVTPDGSCTLNSNLICSFRTDHLSLFAVATVALPFSFTNVTNAELNTVYTASVTVSWVSSWSVISISWWWWQYQIWTWAFTSATWTVSNWDVVTVRLTSPNAFSTTASTTLTIWWASTTFSVTTKAPPSWGGWGGGWGWWWGSLLFPDYCPGWDTSSSYYDKLCAPWVPATPGPGTIPTWTWTTWTWTTWTWVITFSDIASSFAREDILDFARRWILRWYPDWTFRPNNPITRAEFLWVSMKTLWISTDVNATVSFVDIPSEWSWMIPYIAKAWELGIAYGQIIDWQRKFRPNDPVTRAEALTMLLNAAKISVSEGVSTNFVDIPTETSWAIKYISKAQELWIISWQISVSWDPIFRPNDAITRAEAVRIIKNALAESWL
ncbi:MAG: S-layer protein [uncultured bacterium (gcode 4)]|uniref:S-layer protein n=1 Tax=uncultured bacterium (gcode 4) TaxID=1234023 RepID=K2H1N0_9BACT|nr:MAG: S-layer protein [uncultured bacterium (gcode 4)]